MKTYGPLKGVLFGVHVYSYSGQEYRTISQ